MYFVIFSFSFLGFVIKEIFGMKKHFAQRFVKNYVTDSRIIDSSVCFVWFVDSILFFFELKVFF